MSKILSDEDGDTIWNDPTPNIDDELREQILTLGMCNGPYDNTHRCSNMHCEHCGLCDVVEDIIEILANKIKEAELRGRIDELGGVKEHHESIPLPWEVGTGPYIEGRLTQLTNQHKGES